MELMMVLLKPVIISNFFFVSDESGSFAVGVTLVLHASQKPTHVHGSQSDPGQEDEGTSQRVNRDHFTHKDTHKIHNTQDQKQALRDHRARDCRFLSFKKGDMIDVYHKLSRLRSELWAGSKDKDFGYFSRDAVKLDEVFVDDKKEIEMQTQKTDFLCMDAFGTIISSEEDFEDHEFGDQTSKSEDLGNSDFDDRDSKSSKPNENVKVKLINNNKDRGKKAEQSRASWIRAAVSGWFANDAGDSKDKEENSKSRKLALNMKELSEKCRRTKASAQTEDELSSALELKEEETENDEESTSELGNRIESVRGFKAGEDTSSSETIKQSQNENMQILSTEQEVDSLKEKASKVMITEDEKRDAGWYGNVFNTITKLYGDPSYRSEASKKEGK
ncbi:Melanoma inhibitory activity protein 2 [Bagarius yarrelli]|uniref:Melanoma inhibitory activity protein 2 n=1 Tax=Bagarius yarrelli TaxID=175774 RepID=A0A556VVR0_BAGYA|nr:Melanoma inhibitory activity protein 2 [Bagarius yarrelli]